MEHSMTKILKFLPRATSSVSFQNPPLYSPTTKDKKISEKPRKSNFGPMIPLDTGRKIKNDSTYEPTSPRVSCMGQVKCKHYRKLTGADKLPNNNNKFSRTTSYAPTRTYDNEEDKEKVVKVDQSKKKLGFRSLFNGGSRRKSDATDNKSKSKTAALTIPKGQCLSTMKRFSSGRDAFINFDWTTQVAPAPLDSGHRNSFTDEVVVPSSAPVMVRNKGISDNFVRVGGVINIEPRKEINLWKRRTMAQPQPLQVHGVN